MIGRRTVEIKFNTGDGQPYTPFSIVRESLNGGRPSYTLHHAAFAGVGVTFTELRGLAALIQEASEYEEREANNG